MTLHLRWTPSLVCRYSGVRIVQSLMDINLRDPCLILHQSNKAFEKIVKSHTRVTTTTLENTENVYFSEEFEGDFL